MHKIGPWFLALLLGWGLARMDATPRATASGPPDFTPAVTAAEASVVHVATQVSARSRDEAVGSGFVLTPDGLIATSRHVLAGAQSVMVSVAGREPVRAQVLGTDDRVDVALLQAPLTGLTPLAIGSTQGLQPGQWVLACGSPYGLERSWSCGIISGLHRRGVAANPNTYEDFIQSDAAANLGNSGGPLLDVNGRALGMVTQILTRAGGFQGISLSTPIEAVMDAVNRLRGARGAGGAAPRPSLGLLVRDTPKGVQVTQAPPGSAAAAAGILAGEYLRSVSGTPVRTVSDVERALLGRTVGERVQVEIQPPVVSTPDGGRVGKAPRPVVLELR